jgi:hypothetical protein
MKILILRKVSSNLREQGQQVLSKRPVDPPKLDYSLCGFSSVHGDTIAVLEAYIDESGSHDDKLLVIAGYVSQVERWVSFSQEWKKILVDHSLSYFHMKDFRNPKSRAYRHLAPRDKENLLDALVNVIHHNVLFGIAFLVSPAVYSRLTTPAFRSRHGSCYSMAAQGCLGLAFHFLRQLGSSAETVGIFVEEGHKNDREVIEALGEFKRQTDPIDLPDDLDGAVYGGPLDMLQDPYSGEDDPLRRRGVKVGAYGLGSKKIMLPLQAADIFAYCAHGFARRPDAYFCRGVIDKLRGRVPHYGYACGKKQLLELMEGVKKEQVLKEKQRHDYYLLERQLGNCGFKVEKLSGGISVSGSTAKMEAFFTLNGMKPIEDN